jgi:hypothetical protein
MHGWRRIIDTHAILTDDHLFMSRKLSLALLATLALVWSGQGAVLFDRGADWRWRPGTNEASTPISAWRELGFNDTQFTTAPAPFWYGDAYPGGTQISGMQNVYLCIFLRKTFLITNLSEIGGLRLGSLVDDGFVAWINGTKSCGEHARRQAQSLRARSPLMLSNRFRLPRTRCRHRPRTCSRHQRYRGAGLSKQSRQQRPWLRRITRNSPG